MIFSTYQFILVFLPIVFGIYFILNKLKFNTISKIWLVVASLYFYASGSKAFFPFFLASIFGNYLVGIALSKLQGNENKRERKLLLLIGVFANVLLLCYYKYMNFFIENINFLLKTNIPIVYRILPIGISFFTFQLIAFLVDSYRGETKEYNIIDYLLFITFFPQLIVGPIVHHKEMVSQFENKENSKLNWDNIAVGLFVFSIGCAKKMLIADVLTTNAQSFYVTGQTAFTFLNTWFYSLEYTISYYFDLSGYADMAIGLGLMFNIIIPQNFNSPYKATDFQEYWKRWHITLSRFLGTYIFKNIYQKDNKWRNYYIATMITFFVSGFWHGAGWNFIIWGLVNGVLVCIASYRNRKGKKTPYVLAWIVNFILVILTRVLFVSENFTYAWNVYKGMFNFSSLANVEWIAFWNNNWRAIITTITGLGICLFTPNTEEIRKKFKTSVPYLIYAVALLSICLITMDKVVNFLYFQF
ncbi:MAG: MBOAT family protein [Clostridia bacterium]|nr:MBOAT family protein [Clostridia bacterium]